MDWQNNTPPPGGDREMLERLHQELISYFKQWLTARDSHVGVHHEELRRLVSLATEALDLRERVRELEQQLEAEKDEYQGAAHDAARFEERCKELEAENKRLRAELHKLKSKAGELRQSNGFLASRAHRAENEAARLRKIIERDHPHEVRITATMLDRLKGWKTKALTAHADGVDAGWAACMEKVGADAELGRAVLDLGPGLAIRRLYSPSIQIIVGEDGQSEYTVITQERTLLEIGGVQVVHVSPSGLAVGRADSIQKAIRAALKAAQGGEGEG